MALAALVARNYLSLVSKGFIHISRSFWKLQKAHRLALKRLLLINEEFFDSELRGLSIR